MVTESDTLLGVLERHKNLVTIIREVSSSLNTTHDLDRIFDSTFQLLDQYFSFKHIMILLVEEEHPSRLVVRASNGYKGQGIGAIVPFGRGVVGVVAKNRKLLRMSSVRQNYRYIAVASNRDTHEVPLPGISNCASQLAVPLLSHEELVGVLSIESSNVGLFDQKDEELLQMIGVQIGVAINNAHLFTTINRTNAQLQDLNENLEKKVLARTAKLASQKQQIVDQHALLEKQHSSLESEQRKTRTMLKKIETLFGQQVSKEVAKELLKDEKQVMSKAFEVTVMFLDIRDFTTYADARAPEEVALFQNIVFGEILDLVRKHHGITNQILGDGIMAVFGAPVSNDSHTHDEVAAGFAILSKVKALGDEGRIPNIRLGIGLHSGNVLAGNIGNELRKQYSLTGSTVIIASRIEQLNKTYHSQYLVSETVFEKIKQCDYSIKSLGDCNLKGIEKPVGVYQLD